MQISPERLEDWRTIADDLGLHFSGLPLCSINGLWKGHSVEIKLNETPKGLTTDFVASSNHAFNTSFQITRQGVTQNLAELMGARDIQIGDATFDSAALIKGWNEEVIRKLFGSETVRATCLKLLSNDYYQNVEITHQGLSTSVAGVVETKSGMSTILQIIIDTISALESIDRGHEEPPEPEPQPLPEPSAQEEAEVEIPVEEKAEPLPEPEKIEQPPVPFLTSEELSNLFQQELKEAQVDWCGEIIHIVPDDNGWLATLRLLEIPDRGKCDIVVKYRIGQNRKDQFDHNHGTRMKIKGELERFEPTPATLYIDSGDAVTPPESHSATVLIQI